MEGGVAAMVRRFTMAMTIAIVLGAALAAPVSGSTRRPAAQSVDGELRPGALTYLRVRHTDAAGRIPARPPASTRASSVHATFVVTYHGFPAAARASFQRAVDLWSTLISSSVPIQVDATWKPLPTDVLGGAGPAEMYRAFRGTGMNIWWPIASANARAGKDLSAGPDIVAEFASTGVPWYYGTDGATPSDQVDLTTVVLHELAHGLALFDSFEVEGNRGYFGLGSPYSFLYDQWVKDASGAGVGEYPSGSVALGTMLRSGHAYFDGGQAYDANGFRPVKLYAPATFLPGTSISHLDEDTYPPGDPNSLMTPYLDDGESIYDPGDVVLAMFRDLAWKTAGPIGLPAAPSAPTVSAGEGRVQVSWATPVDTGRRRLTGQRLFRYEGDSATATQTYDLGPGVTSLSVAGLADGSSQRFAVAAANDQGLGPTSPQSEVAIPFPSAPFTDASAIVRRQYLDFLGRSPNGPELALWRTLLNRGSDTPAEVIDAIAHLESSSVPRARVTRLYRAYFGRLPDYGGFQYWLRRLRSGTSLTKVSDTFAASSEFARTYGSLSNRSFVVLVYRNVLHREPDPSGLAFWVRRLDQRVQGRGSVMLAFSESSENIRKSQAGTDSVLLRSGMLGRMPTGDEFADDVALLEGPATSAVVAGQVLALGEYAARVAP